MFEGQSLAKKDNLGQQAFERSRVSILYGWHSLPITMDIVKAQETMSSHFPTPCSCLVQLIWITTF